MAKVIKIKYHININKIFYRKIKTLSHNIVHYISKLYSTIILPIFSYISEGFRSEHPLTK